MKMRNKGKVYPSPSSSSSSSSSSMSSYTANRDILKLLPAAILALISILSSEDREALAYMITRSMKSVNPSSSSIDEERKRNNKKSSVHKPPVFDCECFDCYRSYWFKWDSSPNRELIHQAIEAFEEHLAGEEQAKRSSRGKKREKMGRRGPGKPIDSSETPAADGESDLREIEEGFVVVMPEIDGSPVVVTEKAEATARSGGEEVEEEEEEEAAAAAAEAAAAVLESSAANNNKGLVRKVLPDVVALLNSRLWSLWSPNA